MSVSIDAASPQSHGLTEAMDAVRPQVRSRRLSFKLGPLGVSYASDQVLWGAAAGATGAASLAASEASDAGFSTVSETLPGADADDTAQARRAESERAALTQAGQVAVQQAAAQRASIEETASSGRSFDSEMFAAWRRQVGQRVSGDVTYGPDGALRGAQALDGARKPGSMAGAAPGGAIEKTEEGVGEPAADAASVSAAGMAGPMTDASTQGAGGFSTSRMRRAIAAYLSCAAVGSSGGSMLTAVA